MVFYGTLAQIGYVIPWTYEIYIIHVLYTARDKHITLKKALRKTQTLRAGCSKAEPKIFALPQTPFPGVQDGQNLISWKWPLLLPTNPVW